MNEQTKKLLAPFIQMAPAAQYFTGMFASDAGSLYDQQTILWDAQRETERIAVPVDNISAGYRINEKSVYTSKELVPAVLKESGTFNAHDLQKRMPGNTTFDSPEFQAAALSMSRGLIRTIMNKMRRTQELMAAQIMQTGKNELKDKDGNVVYTADFFPDTDHVPTAAVAWGLAGSKPLVDLESLCAQIRTKGLVRPTSVTMGSAAWRAFVADATVQTLLDNRRYEFGNLGGPTATAESDPTGLGAFRQGEISVGDNRLVIYTYDNRYIDPETGDSVPYLDPAKVVVSTRGLGTSMEAAFGSIPRFVPPDGRVMGLIPEGITATDRLMNLYFNAWLSKDNEAVHIGVGTRPAMIPKAIDSFGCLDTLAT